jgi:hypothetical protein
MHTKPPIVGSEPADAFKIVAVRAAVVEYAPTNGERAGILDATQSSAQCRHSVSSVHLLVPRCPYQCIISSSEG